MNTTNAADAFVTSAPRPRSLLGRAPLLIVALILVANVWQSTDPDLWGHIRFGQEMIASRHAVSRDPYSYTAAGRPWHDHEYLSEVSLAFVYDRFGVVGLKMWKLALVSATVVLLALALAETGASVAIQMNTLAVAIAAIAPHMQFRPQLYTYALLAAMLLMLARDNYRRSGQLWAVVPLMALWANLHGGFVAGLAALFAYALVKAALEWRARRRVQIAAIAVAATLATLVTPYGVEGWRTVFTTLWTSPTFRIFADWQPLTAAFRDQWRFNHWGIAVYLCFIALVAALAAGLIARPRGGDLPLVAIALLMTAAAFKAVRNVPLAAIPCTLPVARHGMMAMAESRGKKPEPAAASHWPQWIVAGAALAMAAVAGEFSPRLPLDMPYPSGAVEFMKEHGLRGNILSAFEWGEYLIWHMGPESRVFVDSRYDMVYPIPVVLDYIAFYFSGAGGEQVLRKYPHDFALLPPAAPAARLMAKARGWGLIYRDRDSLLFARSQLPASPIQQHGKAAHVPAARYFP